MVRHEYFTPPGGQGAGHTRPQRNGGVGGLSGVSMACSERLSTHNSSEVRLRHNKSVTSHEFWKLVVELLNFADLSSEEYSAHRELPKLYDLYVNSSQGIPVCIFVGPPRHRDRGPTHTDN